MVSNILGSVQRLPNANTLIVESDNGRVFEVDTEGTVVWEFFSPHRAGNEGQYIASIYDLVRLPFTEPPSWVDPATVTLSIDFASHNEPR